MCKLVIAVLLSDYLVVACFLTAYIKLFTYDEKFNFFNYLFSDNLSIDEHKNEIIIMGGFTLALLIHVVTIIVRTIYEICKCCCYCCCDCRDPDITNDFYY